MLVTVLYMYTVHYALSWLLCYFLRFSYFVCLGIFGLFLFYVVSTSVIDCLNRPTTETVPETTDYVSRRTLSNSHSRLCFVFLCF